MISMNFTKFKAVLQAALEYSDLPEFFLLHKEYVS